MVADPDPADHAAAGLDELSQPGRARPGPPRAGDPVPHRRDHPDRARPGRAPVGLEIRPPGDDLPARRLQQRPHDQQKAALDYVTEASKKRRRDDLAGRGRLRQGAAGRGPPRAQRAQPDRDREHVDRENTDLGAAVKLALATFPEDTARRIVVLSDGNENRGNLFEQALTAKSLGVQVDVLPIEYFYDREVLVEKVSIPPDVKKGETVNINVVIRASEPTRGTLQIFQKSDNYRAPAAGNEQPVPVELDRGINVKTLKQLITEPNFYTFSRRVHSRQGQRRPPGDQQHRRGVHPRPGQGPGPLDRGHARRARRAGQGPAREGDRGQGAGRPAGSTARAASAATRCRPTWPSFSLMTAVILANVPKEAFTESQHELLATNCHDMGAGLVMIGGPDSFGAGGWMNTPVEKALPVDMQIKAMKVQGIGAMVLIMHASEIPEGNYWQKVVAKAAISSLSSYDYAGLLHWEGQEAWLFTLRPIGTGRSSMLRAIDRMTPGDMPDFDPSLQMAMKGLNAVQGRDEQAHRGHQRRRPDAAQPRVINQLAASKITVTAVLTARPRQRPRRDGRHAEPGQPDQGPLLQRHQPPGAAADLPEGSAVDLAAADLRAGTPWLPKLNYPITEPVMGLPEQLPAITGLVLTSAKENELVEIPIVSPLPAGQINPVLAHWTYGLGRSVAFTSDAGRRWAKTWPDWQNYAAFWSQVDPLVDAPGRPRQPHAERPPRAGADQGRHRRPRQEQRVPQLPPHPGQRGRPRPEVTPRSSWCRPRRAATRRPSRTPRPAATTSSTSDTAGRTTSRA